MQCIKCCTEKDNTEFSKYPNGKIQKTCKDCLKIYKRSYYEKHKNLPKDFPKQPNNQYTIRNIPKNICTKCLIEKPEVSFPINKYSGNRRNICSDCLKQYGKKWRNENKEYANSLRKIWATKNKDHLLLYHQQRNKKLKELGFKRERIKSDEEKQANRIWREKNKDILKLKSKLYYNKNKEKRLLHSKKWREQNKEKAKQMHKSWMDRNKDYYKEIRKDPIFRLKLNLRRRVSRAIKSQLAKKSKHTLEMLGCTWEVFIKHIEQKFRDGMTWENYAIFWEIDHIKPCNSFNLLNQNEQNICFHYTNLQPLTKSENRIKGAKII